MTTQGDTTSFWIKFFTDAGIPAGDAAHYAVTFTDNRITREMLLDLNKEYLNDMGIAMMGDIISILKHAKVVSAQDVTQAKVARAASFSPASQTASTQITIQNSPVRRSTPLSRTVAHILKTDTDPDAVPMNESTPPQFTDTLASRLGPSPASTPPRIENRPSPSNVFSRLGNESSSSPGSSRSSSPLSMSLSARLEAAKYESKYSSPTDKAKAGPVVDRKKATPTQTKVTVTGLGKMVISSTPAEEPSVFKRLGAAVKRPATSTTMEPEEEEGCEYAGVLQPSRVKKKKVTATSSTGRPKAESVLSRLGPKSGSSLMKSEGIMSAEAEAEEQEKVKTPVVQKKKITAVKASASTTAKLSVKKAKGVLSRLGPQPAEVSSSADAKPKMIKLTKTIKTGASPSRAKTAATSAGVFGRLGKKLSS